MLGASSSEEEDDDYYNYASTDRDDVSEILVQPVPNAPSNRKTSFRSIRSISPTESDGVSISGSIKGGGLGMHATGNGFPGGPGVYRGSSFRQQQGHLESGHMGGIMGAGGTATTPMGGHRTTSQTGSLSPSPSMRSLSTLSEKRAANASSLVSVNEASTPDTVTPKVSKEEEER